MFTVHGLAYIWIVLGSFIIGWFLGSSMTYRKCSLELEEIRKLWKA